MKIVLTFLIKPILSFLFLYFFGTRLKSIQNHRIQFWIWFLMNLNRIKSFFAFWTRFRLFGLVSVWAKSPVKYRFKLETWPCLHEGASTGNQWQTSRWILCILVRLQLKTRSISPSRSVLPRSSLLITTIILLYDISPHLFSFLTLTIPSFLSLLIHLPPALVF